MLLFNFSAVKQLIEAGADVNLGDDYSNITQMAQEKHMHPMHGM